MLNPSSKGQLLLMRTCQGIGKMFALDARSLAFFRVMIALTTITDVMTRYPDAHNHYSDSGMFPREFIMRSFTNYYWITLHMVSGAEFVMKCLFLLEIACAACLLVGYRTRTMTIISWIFVCSVQNRNYVLGHSGDTVHRLFLFCGIFLPLSRVFSVDRALARASDASARDVDDHDHARDHERRKAEGSSRYEFISFAGALFIVQLLVMYYMAHYHKTGAEWREKGVAAWMALQLDYFRTWFGDMLLWWTPGVIFGNYAVLAWQWWGSVMYFSPIYNKYFRALTCLGFTAMHAAFGMAFYLETFTWATLAACVGIIPEWVWDLVISRLSNLSMFAKPIQIHVVPNCKICMNIAKIIDEFMLPGKSKITLASRLPTNSLPCSCGSKCNWNESHFFGISVTDQNKAVHHGPVALDIIAKSSPLLYPLHFVLRTKWARMGLQFISRVSHNHSLNYFANDSASLEEATEAKFSFGGSGNRHLHFDNFEVSQNPAEFSGIVVEPEVSKKEFFEDQSNNFTFTDVKEASKLGAKAAKETFLAFLLYLIIACNMGNLNHQHGVPSALQPVLWAFQLDQYWGMFAPRPPDITWWYNFEGHLDDGTHVELFNNGAMHTFIPNIPHTFDKPNIHLSIGNHRWFKLFENGLNSHSQREDIRLYFGRWFCREYNSRNPGSKRVHKYAIHFMYERLDMEKMDGSRFPPARETIWNHMCYEK